MTVYYSSDFGWSEGQDISDEFIALVANNLQPGDTLVLEGMYKISGANIQLPDGFTLSAVQGAGLDIVDANASSNPLLLMGNGGTIDNVTFLASGSPDTGYEGTHAKQGVDFHIQTAVGIRGADNVTISNCDFSGNLRFFLDVVSSDGLVIEGTHFEGSFVQVRLLGDTKDAYISGSHFENALSDGIKTVSGGEYGPQRVTVVDSLFEGANRDGIDMAGGFKDSLVSNTVFYGNGHSAMDIKTIIEKTSHLSSNISNNGIRIEDCQIIDSNNGIVVTMLDRLGVLTAANADELMPHDIQVVNTIFENISKNAIVVKDGYNITWTDLTFLGNFNELRLLNAEAPDGWTAYNVEGTVSTQGAPRNLSADDLWTNDVGPVSGTQTEPTSDDTPTEPTSGDDTPTEPTSGDDTPTEPTSGDDEPTEDADEIYGNGSTIWAGGGDDTLFGGDGPDTMHGQDGNDTVSYAGSATGVGASLKGSPGWGGAEGDTIFTVENLVGSAHDDVLVGSNQANRIEGTGGNDTIYAKGGNDTLVGGAGDDILYGQGGHDQFLFADGFGNDVIMDFRTESDKEKIDLSAVSAITDWADLTNPDNPHMTQVGTKVVIDDFAGNTLTLQGVDLTDLSMLDFVF